MHRLKYIIILVTLLILILGYFITTSLIQNKNESQLSKLHDVQLEENKEFTLEESNNAQPKYNSDEAKAIISDEVTIVTQSIEQIDMDRLAEMIHPEKGIRFSLYGLVNQKEDLIFSAYEVSQFHIDESLYFWGYYPNFETKMELTTKDFFNQNIYHKDFSSANKIGYNQVISSSGYPENQFIVYPDSIIVEYYFENEDIIWRSIRFVFERYKNGEMYLVGIISNQWTP